jgi:Inosine-uridine preferring nucleoside hydrolase
MAFAIPCRMRTICSVALQIALLFLPLASSTLAAQSAPESKVIIDTDIGDDIDDVFAVDLALISPEIHVIGISAAWGDTALRARMLDRLTCEIGRTDIPVQTGPATTSKTTFSQKPWAEQGIERTTATPSPLSSIRSRDIPARSPFSRSGRSLTLAPRSTATQRPSAS